MLCYVCTSVCTYLSTPIPTKKKKRKKKKGVPEPPRKKREKKKKKKKKSGHFLPPYQCRGGGEDLMGCKKAIGCVFWGVGEVHDGRSLGGLRL